MSAPDLSSVANVRKFLSSLPASAKPQAEDQLAFGSAVLAYLEIKERENLALKKSVALLAKMLKQLTEDPESTVPPEPGVPEAAEDLTPNVSSGPAVNPQPVNPGAGGPTAPVAPRIMTQNGQAGDAAKAAPKA